MGRNGRRRAGEQARCHRRRLGVVLAMASAIVAIAPRGAFPAPRSQLTSSEQAVGRFLADLSLEELVQVEVTLVSRIPERRFDAPAAIFVLTREDIRRSGVSSLPEVLRLVPGVHVARMDANTWAISARGFNGQYSRKLLVLVDGRSVYTPLFSGVYWDVQDLPLEVIERIEVVRGPGGILWGANAVNGIINIVTTSAWDRAGGLFSLNGGVEERGVATVLYGDRVGEQMAYRVHGRVAEHGGFFDTGADEWEIGQGGFRVDWRLGDGSFTLLGGGYDGTSGERRRAPLVDGLTERPLDFRTQIDGGHLLARFERRLAGGSSMRAQLYADRERRSDAAFAESVETLDGDVQLHLSPAHRHHLTVGGGYRLVDDRLRGSSTGSFEEPQRRTELWSGFIEDRIAVVPDRVGMVLGARLEHNDYTGFELQPTARLFFTPQRRQTVWLAVSQAVRTPSRVESDASFDLDAQPVPGPRSSSVLRLLGNPDLEAEELTAYELGYRVQPADSLVLDLALFRNQYDELVKAVPGEPFLETSDGARRSVVPLALVNGPGAETEGVELELRWQPKVEWELALAYTAVREEISPTDATESPPQQVVVRSLLDLGPSLELDVAALWTDRLPDLGIDSYLRLDVRLGFRPREGLEAAVGARNLGGDAHPEFAGGLSGAVAVDVQPQLYARVTLRW